MLQEGDKVIIGIYDQWIVKDSESEGMRIHIDLEEKFSRYNGYVRKVYDKYGSCEVALDDYDIQTMPAGNDQITITLSTRYVYKPR